MGKFSSEGKEELQRVAVGWFQMLLNDSGGGLGLAPEQSALETYKFAGQIPEDFI